MTDKEAAVGAVAKEVVKTGGKAALRKAMTLLRGIGVGSRPAAKTIPITPARTIAEKGLIAGQKSLVDPVTQRVLAPSATGYVQGRGPINLVRQLMGRQGSAVPAKGGIRSSLKALLGYAGVPAAAAGGVNINRHIQRPLPELPEGAEAVSDTGLSTADLPYYMLGGAGIGGGASALYGAATDNTDRRRDLLAALLGAAGGTGLYAYRNTNPTAKAPTAKAPAAEAPAEKQASLYTGTLDDKTSTRMTDLRQRLTAAGPTR